MSGIFGIFQKRDTPPLPATLSAMHDAMGHWGPDGAFVWHSGPVGLGLMLLADTAEARGERLPAGGDSQPDVVVAADTRLDNRDEICDRAGIPHSERPALTDSALIALAYAKWGAQCARHLLGDFAFVLWDARSRQLFCARDPMGCRPFYYYDGPDRFVFASDLRAILAVDGVPQRLDETMVLAEYMAITRHLRSRTCFVDIARLPQGHSLMVQAGRTKTQVDWEPQPQPELRLESDAAYAERLRELLAAAVTCRLRGARPVGVHLSGGLDSSAIAVLAARHSRATGQAKPLAYSWSPPPDANAEPDDERGLVELICAQEQLTCRYTTVTADDAMRYAARDVSVEPTDTLLRELAVCRMAQAQGVRIMLSGWGGDECVSFNGRGYLAELFARGAWHSWAGEIWRRAKSPANGGWKRIAAETILPVLPDTAFALAGRDLHAGAHAVLARAGRHGSPLVAQARELLRGQWHAIRARPGVRRNQVRLLSNGHLAHRMEAWAAAGAQHAIVHRYPLLDRRLLEFGLALPPRLYQCNGLGRYLFRLALSGVVPAAVQQHRSKREPALTTDHQRISQEGFERFLIQWQTGEARGNPFVLEMAARYHQVVNSR
ncbi:MAG: hypothetical protein H3C34_20670 [Caldilineaceae bacterium]|nr:hypothetical protein [Caldilineaceae bacterium]